LVFAHGDGIDCPNMRHPVAPSWLKMLPAVLAGALGPRTLA
jgi:hypothetical protein